MLLRALIFALLTITTYGECHSNHERDVEDRDLYWRNKQRVERQEEDEDEGRISRGPEESPRFIQPMPVLEEGE